MGELPPQDEQSSNPDRYTPANFFERWGDKLGFMTESELAYFWEAARSEYDESTPYHNFSHAVESAWEAMRLADYAEEHGLFPARKPLFGATLLHDAGHHKDEKFWNYPTKEEHSGGRYSRIVPAYGFSRRDIILGETIIIETTPGATPTTLESKLAVRADLRNITGGFQEFIDKTWLLAEEAYRRDPSSFDPRSFVAASVRMLATTLSNDLLLGPFDDRWPGRAPENVQRLAGLFGIEPPPELAA